MKTRTFILDQNGDRCFWDITWEGCTVEITTGKWGTNGRARQVSLESVLECDAFIAREIRKVLGKGYSETSEVAPAAEPAPTRITATVDSVNRRLRASLRSAWLPVFEPGEGSACYATVRGPMTLDRDESWPCCPICREPLAGLLELDCARLPAPHLRDNSVVQLFWCESWEARPGGKVCTAEGGWLARRQRRLGRRCYRGANDKPPCRIIDWVAIQELPPAPEGAVREALEDASDEVLRALLTSAGGGFDVDHIDAVYAHLAKALGLNARNEHKLGGWPTFVQECSVPFAHAIFQLEDKSPFAVNFGDAGAGHLLARADGAVHFFWSCH